VKTSSCTVIVVLLYHKYWWYQKFSFSKFISLLSSYLITFNFTSLVQYFIWFPSILQSQSVKQGSSHYLPVGWPHSLDICYPRALYLYSTFCFLAWLFFMDCLTLKMEALRSFKALGTMHQTTHHTAQDLQYVRAERSAHSLRILYMLLRYTFTSVMLTGS